MAVVALAVALVLSGCAAVGPDYEKPELAAPDRWSEAPAAATPSAIEQVAWWQRFGDPLLDELVAEAVRSNLDLRQAQARIVQARAALTFAGAAELPAVNVAGSANRGQGSRNAAAASQAGTLAAATGEVTTLYKAGFDAAWEIDIFGGTRRSVEAAQARLDASVDDSDAVLLTLLGEVARNYAEFRGAREQLAVSRRNADAQQTTVEVTRERYRLGLAGYLDTAQAESQLATTRANLPTLEAAAKRFTHALAILLGKDPNALRKTLSADAPIPRADAVTALGLPSELLQRRPDLLRAERQLAAASAEIGVATAEQYPRFDLSAGLGLQSFVSGRFFESGSRYWSIVPGVRLPVFDGGRIRAGIESRQAQYDEALYRYQDTFNRALAEVENALAGYYGDQARRQALLKAVSANQTAVDLANERYRKGLSTFLEVLIAERNVYVTQSSLSQTETDLATDLIALYKALGGGWRVPGLTPSPAAGEPRPVSSGSPD